MSRVGKAPVKIPSGVKVSVAGAEVKVEGPKGKLSAPLPECLELKIEGDTITVAGKKGFEDDKNLNALQGTLRSNVQNMVSGCHQEFSKEMDIIGVGYRAAVKGKTLNLTLGFSHPVDYPLPEGVSAKVDKNTHLTLSSSNKVLLGRVAAEIRKFRPPEPYQGKGIRYSDERIIRKQGKAAASK